MGALVDLTGQRFGRLVAVRRNGTNKAGASWDCVCDCGNRSNVGASNLRSGGTESCGCWQRECAVLAGQSRGKHRMSGSAIYSIWRGMIARCSVETHQAFKDYGGRGINVCDEWLDFQRFYDDFGRTRPSHRHSIERENNEDGYRLGNVRWALPVEQQNNRRDNVRVTHEGRTQTIAQWAREAGMSHSAIAHRLKVGWSVERALTTPSNRTGRAALGK